MKTEDQYLMFVCWSEEDSLYLGYCPDLFPYGAACHSESRQEAYRLLCDIVSEIVTDAAAEGRTLPEPKTRPMRELEVA